MPVAYNSRAHDFSIRTGTCTQCQAHRHEVAAGIVSATCPATRTIDAARPVAPEPAPRYCRDCRYMNRPMLDGLTHQWTCQRPSGSVSLVSGEIEPLNLLCVVEREPNGTGTTCGRAAVFFVPTAGWDSPQGQSAPTPVPEVNGSRVQPMVRVIQGRPDQSTIPDGQVAIYIPDQDETRFFIGPMRQETLISLRLINRTDLTYYVGRRDVEATPQPPGQHVRLSGVPYIPDGDYVRIAGVDPGTIRFDESSTEVVNVADATGTLTVAGSFDDHPGAATPPPTRPRRRQGPQFGSAFQRNAAERPAQAYTGPEAEDQ